MQIIIDPLTGFYIVGAIVVLGLILLTLPTLIHREGKRKTKKA